MDPNFGGEGGYVICKNWIKDSQGIVNIGINGFDAFGCQVSAEGNFINEQYDCYNLTETPCADNGYQNHMHNSCLGEKTEEDHEGRKYQTYQNILRETHLENKRIILKIDCEGCEFPGLKYIPVEMFDKVDMIVGEWHLRTGYMEEWGILDIVRTLTEKFVVVNLHMTNFACSFSPLRKVKALAMEYTMVNKKLITKRSESQSYALHPLNKPSVNQNKDCQII